jgi:hypothetical protein
MIIINIATCSKNASSQPLLGFLLSQKRVAMPSATIQAIDSAVIIGFTPAPISEAQGITIAIIAN